MRPSRAPSPIASRRTLCWLTPSGDETRVTAVFQTVRF
jgi:hypothetical protein